MDKPQLSTATDTGATESRAALTTMPSKQTDGMCKSASDWTGLMPRRLGL